MNPHPYYRTVKSPAEPGNSSPLYVRWDFHSRLEENSRDSDPSFRLEKCARTVNSLARGRSCDLLEIGCWPTTLATLLQKNIAYFGMDIAIPEPAPNLLELDYSQDEIKFGSRNFDIVVAAGVFEYLGGREQKKLREIRDLLNDNGTFVLAYTNFEHLNDSLLDRTVYNNIQTIRDFKEDLELFFHVESCFPSSHNWHRTEPNRRFLKRLQMPLEMNLPLISRLLAVSYFFVCSPK